MDPTIPESQQRTDLAPLIVYVLFVLICIYWSLHLMLFVETSLRYDPPRQSTLAVALVALNILVFALTTLVAFKTFDGQVRLGVFTIVTVIAASGLSWLNSTFPMPSIS
jgi:hypothetical protein